VQINLAPGLAGVPLGPLVAERTAIPTYIESLHRKLEAVLDRWDSYDAVRQDRITRTVRYVVDTDDEEHDLRSPIGFVDDGEQVDDLLKAIAPDLLS